MCKFQPTCTEQQKDWNIADGSPQKYWEFVNEMDKLCNTWTWWPCFNSRNYCSHITTLVLTPLIIIKSSIMNWWQANLDNSDKNQQSSLLINENIRRPEVKCFIEKAMWIRKPDELQFQATTIMCKTQIFCMKCVTFKLQMSLQRWNCEGTETLQTAQNSLINHILNTNLEIIKYAQTHLKKLQEFILPDDSYCQLSAKGSSIQNQQNLILKNKLFFKVTYQMMKHRNLL